MTPKEKAKELYGKYEFVYIQNYTSKHEVKQCCLIAADEIIDTVNKYSIHSDCPEDAESDYWEQVKAEIEKL